MERVSMNPDHERNFHFYSKGWDAGIMEFQDYLVQQLDDVINNIDYAVGENYDRLKQDIRKMIMKEHAV
jgi:hypothetical protein